MRNKIVMIGPNRGRFFQFRESLEKDGYLVKRFEKMSDARTEGMDMILFDYDAIPIEGWIMPKDIPVLGFRSDDQAFRKRLIRIEILKAGADDNLKNLDRVRYLLDQFNAEERPMVYRDLVMDVAHKKTTVDGVTIPLSNREFRLLRYLMENQGTILTRDQIYEHVWGKECDETNKTVDVYISHLRDKLNVSSFRKTYITTVRGRGYTIGEIARPNHPAA